jgi:hypothetical protein
VRRYRVSNVIDSRTLNDAPPRSVRAGRARANRILEPRGRTRNPAIGRLETLGGPSEVRDARWGGRTGLSSVRYSDASHSLTISCAVLGGGDTTGGPSVGTPLDDGRTLAIGTFVRSAGDTVVLTDSAGATHAVAGAVVFGILGALIGALAGTEKTEQWRRVGRGIDSVLAEPGPTPFRPPTTVKCLRTTGRCPWPTASWP